MLQHAPASEEEINDACQGLLCHLFFQDVTLLELNCCARKQNVQLRPTAGSRTSFCFVIVIVFVLVVESLLSPCGPGAILSSTL